MAVPYNTSIDEMLRRPLEITLYTTVTDLGRFLSALFAGGRGLKGPLLRSATLEQMWTAQFDAPAGKPQYGIGFLLSELDGHRSVGHNGAIHGFATSLQALPDDKLGVVVVTTMDGANAVTDRVARYALQAMLAVRQNRAMPLPEITSAVPSQTAKMIAGRYAKGTRSIEVTDSAGRLSMCCTKGGEQVRLRSLGDVLIVDDRLSYGERIRLRDNAIILGEETLERVSVPRPPPAPASFRGLIGEYGWDHEILYIFERNGQLWALIEWFEFDLLEPVSKDAFKFPDRGLYAGERLVFTRDTSGQAILVEAAGIQFKRRRVGPASGTAQLRIRPLRPVRELLREALAARPPEERGEFREPDLVEPTQLDPTIKLDVRYAGTNNFLGSVFYPEARAFLQRPAAEALVRAHRALKERGYGVLIHDAYRPWFVTKVFWDATPDDLKKFVADPSQGSLHNRGVAVDLTLYDSKTGQPVDMVGAYDELSDRSYPDYPGGTSLQRWHRELLRNAMEAEGFNVYPIEWWHYDYADWRKYPIGNAPFDRLQ
ncbi:MAG: M15 family metallopeptidase [Steroidobacteraceae bacterium]